MTRKKAASSVPGMDLNCGEKKKHQGACDFRQQGTSSRFFSNSNEFCQGSREEKEGKDNIMPVVVSSRGEEGRRHGGIRHFLELTHGLVEWAFWNIDFEYKNEM